jgi:hypothetical protein
MDSHNDSVDSLTMEEMSTETLPIETEENGPSDPEFSITIPNEILTLFWKSLVRAIGPRRVAVWPKTIGNKVPVVFHVNSHSRRKALKTKTYSRFTFTNIKDPIADSFDYFFSIKSDNLFLNLSPEGLTNYETGSDAPYSSTLPIKELWYQDDYDPLDPWPNHVDRWVQNLHLMTKIRHLTIPLWTLEAEFNSASVTILLAGAHDRDLEHEVEIPSFPYDDRRYYRNRAAIRKYDAV